MTQKETILQSLEDLKDYPISPRAVLNQINNKKYLDFWKQKPQEYTIRTYLRDFIKNNDERVGRMKIDNKYHYYLKKYESEINFDDILQAVDTSVTPQTTPNSAKKKHPTFDERDLHILLSTYLNKKTISAKTIFHEHSKNTKDRNQKWIHPDMVGITFLQFKSKENESFMKLVNKKDTFIMTSYEIKKEIQTDYELKQYFFQAVSNSSWANYGYLVAFEINDNIKDEMERLNQAFGIGIIELKSNPFESKILFQSKLRALDFTTIDKLCHVNPDYKKFIQSIDEVLDASQKHYKSAETSLKQICDKYLEHDDEIKKYCEKHHIPMENEYESDD